MKAMRAWRALALLLLLAGGSAAAQTGRLLLTGSTTMAPLMVEVAKRFQSLHPGIQIEVRMGGSGRGIGDARSGKADIGMVSRPLDAAESDLHGISIARDAPLHALAGPPEGASSELISQYLRLPYEQIKAQRRVGPNAERIAAVAADPRAVVWVSLGEAERKALGGVPIKLLAVGGVAASSRNVRNGNYPISRPLTLVTRGTPTGAARAFIEFCVSAQITDMVVAFDFVPYLD